MNLSRLLLLLIAFLATVAPATGKPPFGVPKSHAQESLLDLRGGGGPINPESVGKVATIAALAQGTLATLGPRVANEQFGLNEELNDDVQVFHAKYMGTGILSLGLMAYYLLFKESPDIRRAVKVSNVLWAYETIRDILSGDAIRGGYSSTSGLKFALACFVFTAYAMTQDYADTVVKAVSVFWGVCGLHLYLFPDSAGKAWNYAPQDDERRRYNAQEFSIFLLSTSIFSGATLFCDGMSHTQALGYAVLPWFLGIAKNIFDGAYKKYGINEGLMWFWLIYHAAIAATTLLF